MFVLMYFCVCIVIGAQNKDEYSLDWDWTVSMQFVEDPEMFDFEQDHKNIRVPLKLYNLCKRKKSNLTTVLEKINTENLKLKQLKNDICGAGGNGLIMTNINGINYHLSPLKKSWYEAGEFCRKYGLELLKIETQQEWNTIRTAVLTFRNIYGDPWIGGSDLGEDGNWKWFETGNKIIYFPGDSKNCLKGGVNCNCMDIRSDGTWCDYSCSTLQTFICEKNVPAFCNIL